MIAPDWVIDGTFDYGTAGPFAFVPVENLDAEAVYVIGMAFISLAPPPGGRVRAIIHPGGDEAAEAYYQSHKEAIDRLLSKQLESGRD